MLDRDGTHDYTPASLPADFPQTPWALHLTDRQRQFRLLGFDLDDHDGHRGADVATDLALLTSVCDELELPYLVCASGSGNGRHLWLHCEPTSALIVDRITLATKALCRTFDPTPLRNPDTGCLRAPGSPHRFGGASTIRAHGEHPTGMHALRALAANPSSTARIAAFADALAGLAQQQIKAPAPKPDTTPNTAPTAANNAASDRDSLALSPAGAAHISGAIAGLGTRRTLQPFAVELLARDPGDDASRTSHTIARAFVYAHRSVDEFIHAALIDKAPGLEHIRTQRSKNSAQRTPRTRPEAHAIRQFQQAVASIPAHHLRPIGGDSSGTSQRRQEATDVALSAVELAYRGAGWVGATGSVFHRTLAALAEVSISRGRRVVTLSSRSWAKQAGLTVPQISLVSRALEDAGWIRCVTPAAGPLAAQWQIVDRREGLRWVTHFSNTAGAHPPGGTSLSIARQMVELAPESGRHDCWELPGLGTTGHAIWLTLQLRGPVSEAGLAGHLGLDPRTVRKTVAALARFDLVRGCGGELLRSLPLSRADFHCAELACVGFQAQRWHRYAAESARWAVRCAERVWRTSLDKSQAPVEVAMLRKFVCVDVPVIRPESSYPRQRGASTTVVLEYAQAWCRRLVDSDRLTHAERVLIEASSPVPPSVPPPLSPRPVLVAA
ncbi:hypothetical protein AB0331_13365 [Dietzia maris]|uniref:hypothetical protein n=1 Tax=Dietzia maris TaxID=37915 RepID=UPI00344C137A